MLHFMAGDQTLGNWPGQPPHPGALMAQIRQIAESGSSHVFFGPHAFDRINQRSAVFEINNADVLRGFRIGEIDSTIEAGNGSSEWACLVTFPYGEDRGSRLIGVATVVDRGTEIFVKTVEWMDRR